MGGVGFGTVWLKVLWLGVVYFFDVGVKRFSWFLNNIVFKI